ncbi:MAG: hypothetical protein U0787_13150 [Polyangia bacterium]
MAATQNPAQIATINKLDRQEVFPATRPTSNTCAMLTWFSLMANSRFINKARDEVNVFGKLRQDFFDDDELRSPEFPRLWPENFAHAPAKAA